MGHSAILTDQPKGSRQNWLRQWDTEGSECRLSDLTLQMKKWYSKCFWMKKTRWSRLIFCTIALIGFRYSSNPLLIGAKRRSKQVLLQQVIWNRGDIILILGSLSRKVSQNHINPFLYRIYTWDVSETSHVHIKCVYKVTFQTMFTRTILFYVNQLFFSLFLVRYFPG